MQVTNPTQSTKKMRAADIAYDAIENLIVTLQIKPGAPIVEADLIEMTGLGRTPLREALMRMSSSGLIQPLPRRGLMVKEIDLVQQMSLIETRRVLERLIISNANRKATPQQRVEILEHAQNMVRAAENGDLQTYMLADQSLDHVMHEASRNPSAVSAVIPLVIKCRRFWYAYQLDGDIIEGARCHLQLAQGIADANEANALVGGEALMDYLDAFTRKVIHS
jgi:DNA-binding GntR family transcriptional regulator